MLYTKLLLDKFFMTDVNVEKSDDGEYVYSFRIPREHETEVKRKLEYCYRHKSMGKEAKKSIKEKTNIGEPRHLDCYKRKYCDYTPINGEIWKEIDKYPGFKISSIGRVMEGNRLLVPSTSNGYLVVSVREQGKKRTQRGIHRLVAEAFIPNPDNKPEVDHINTDRSDNRVENLRWATNFENMFKNETTVAKLRKSPLRLKYHIYNTLKTDLEYMLRDGFIDNNTYELGVKSLDENVKGTLAIC